MLYYTVKYEDNIIPLIMAETTDNTESGDLIKHETLLNYVTSKDGISSFQENYGIILRPKLYQNKRCVVMVTTEQEMRNAVQSVAIKTQDLTGTMKYLAECIMRGENIAELEEKYIKHLVENGSYSETLARMITTQATRQLAPYLIGMRKFIVELPPSTFVLDEELKEFVQENNRTAEAFSIKRDDRRTEFQETEFDKLKIAVPQAKDIRNKLIDSGFDNLNLVFKPYDHPIYAVAYWPEVYNQIDPEKATRVAYDIIKSINKDYIGFYSSEDLEHYRKYAKPVLGDIIGYEINDTLSIEENEMDLYDALIDLIKGYLEISNPENASLLFSTGTLPIPLKNLLNGIIKQIVMYNWSAVGGISLEEMAEERSEEYRDAMDRLSDSSDKEGRYNYPGGKLNLPDGTVLSIGMGRDGFTIMPALLAYIEKYAVGFNSSEQALGAAVYAEAIVKLLRWGERRIANLVFEGGKRAFDMREFVIKQEKVDYESLERATFSGKDYYLDKIISHNLVTANDELLNIICGFMYTEKFNVGEESLYRSYVISNIDYIAKLKDGTAPEIYGIDYNKDDGSISVIGGVEEVLLAAIKSKIGSNDISLVIEGRLAKVADRYKVEHKRLSIFQTFTLSELIQGKLTNAIRIDSDSELEEVCKNNGLIPMKVLQAVYTNYAIHVLKKTNDMDSLQQCLAALLESGLGTFPFLGLVTTNGVTANSNVTGTLDKVDVFKNAVKKQETFAEGAEKVVPEKIIKEEGSKKADEGDTKLMGDTHKYIQQPPKGLAFYAVEGKLPDGEGMLIEKAYIAFEKDANKRIKQVYIASKSDLDKLGNPIAPTSYSAEVIIMLIANMLVKAENNSSRHVEIAVVAPDIMNRLRRRG